MFVCLHGGSLNWDAFASCVDDEMWRTVLGRKIKAPDVGKLVSALRTLIT